MWLLPQLDRHLTRFAATVAKADDSAHTADEAVALAPSILGASGRRTYLLAIVTPAESRGSGGLMANYGVLTVTDGRMHLAAVGRCNDLDKAGTLPKHLAGPPDYLARYDKFDPAGTWQNVTMSPDFPSVANVMAQLYPQSGGVRIDGVIRLDPDALAGLLSLTGPVHVPGLPVTLDAQNAVSFLFRDQYTLITDRGVRVDLLGKVARAVFDRLTSGRSAQPSGFGNALSPAIRTGHLALWFRDARDQALVRRIGADAALPPIKGDSFGVMVQNGGGNKIDEYLHRTVGYTATVTGATGGVHAHAVIVLHNAAPATRTAVVRDRQRGRTPGRDEPSVSLRILAVRAPAGNARRPAIRAPSGAGTRSQRVLDLRRHPPWWDPDDHARPRRLGRLVEGRLPLRLPGPDASDRRPRGLVDSHPRLARRLGHGPCRGADAGDDRRGFGRRPNLSAWSLVGRPTPPALSGGWGGRAAASVLRCASSNGLDAEGTAMRKLLFVIGAALILALGTAPAVHALDYPPRTQSIAVVPVSELSSPVGSAESPASTNSSLPRTGDNSGALIWLGLAFAGTGAFVISSVRGRTRTS